MNAGKGDRDRTADRKAYRENYEAIFGPSKPVGRDYAAEHAAEDPDGTCVWCQLLRSNGIEARITDIAVDETYGS